MFLQAEIGAMKPEESVHFKQMLLERRIRREWVEAALNDAEFVEEHDDGTKHYLKRIPEHGDRWLRIVVTEEANPPRAVTVFFDRRLRRVK